MDPFRNYRQVLPAGQHCPLGRCAACSSGPVLVRQEFADLIGRCWSPEEIDLLDKAASSALL